VEMLAPMVSDQDDTRLKYASRNWGKHEGWEVRPTAIQTIFSRRPGKPRGREWWARVAAELKAGGYLRLSRVIGNGGKLFASHWTFCVFGLDDEIAECGSAVVRSAGTGTTTAGTHRTSSQYPRETILGLTQNAS
jgi:hypothetical protein